MSVPAPTTIGGSVATVIAVGAVGAAYPEMAEPAVQLVGVGFGSAILWSAVDVLRQIGQHLGRIAQEGLTITVHHEHGAAAGEVGRLASAVDRHAAATEATAEIEREPVRPRKVS